MTDTQRAIAQLKATNAALEAGIKRSEDERAQERAARRAREEREALRATLADLGVKPLLVDVAADHLLARQPERGGAWQRDDVTEWLLTAAGREFLAPPTPSRARPLSGLQMAKIVADAEQDQSED